MNATAELLRAASLDLPPVSTEVATTLPVRAEVAFEVFADAGETPRWLSVVQSARVLHRTADGRPHHAAVLRFGLSNAKRPGPMRASGNAASL